MKNFLIAFLLFLCPMVASAQRYTNQQQGFSITLPGVADTSSSDAESFSLSAISSDRTVGTVVVVGNTKLDPNSATAENYSAVVTNSGLVTSNCTYPTIQNRLAERCSYATVNVKGVPLHGTLLLVVNDKGYLYLITAFSVDGAGVDAAPGQIIDSFQLL
jgi:hypothetical protein